MMENLTEKVKDTLTSAKDSVSGTEEQSAELCMFCGFIQWIVQLVGVVVDKNVCTILPTSSGY